MLFGWLPEPALDRRTPEDDGGVGSSAPTLVHRLIRLPLSCEHPTSDSAELAAELPQLLEQGAWCRDDRLPTLLVRLIVMSRPTSLPALPPPKPRAAPRAFCSPRTFPPAQSETECPVASSMGSPRPVCRRLRNRSGHLERALAGSARCPFLRAESDILEAEIRHHDPVPTLGIASSPTLSVVVTGWVIRHSAGS